jgi:hypothetical protein
VPDPAAKSRMMKSLICERVGVSAVRLRRFAFRILRSAPSCARSCPPPEMKDGRYGRGKAPDPPVGLRSLEWLPRPQPRTELLTTKMGGDGRLPCSTVAPSRRATHDRQMVLAGAAGPSAARLGTRPS